MSYVTENRVSIAKTKHSVRLKTESGIRVKCLLFFQVLTKQYQIKVLNEMRKSQNLVIIRYKT
jgi:hypothetical protein